MKVAPLIFVMLAMLFMLQSCGNTPTTPTDNTASDASTSKKMGEIPTANAPTNEGVGIKGAEKPATKAIDATTNEYVYQNYVVRVATDPKNAGEIIMVIPAAGGDPYLIDNLDAYHFAGLYRKYLFVDSGTGPSNRKLIIFDLEKRRADYQANWIGEDAFVDTNGKVWYWIATPAGNIEKLPDCPEKEEWEKQGLQVTYGKREIFLTTSGAVIGKSDFKCFAVQ